MESADPEPPADAAADARPGGALSPSRTVVMPEGADHQPARSSWDCQACGKAWPCDPARERMSRVYSRATLSMIMADRLLDAVGEMPPCPPAELFDRVLAWTRRPPAA